MTDKLQKIREEVERLINQKDENKYLGIVLILELKKVLSFIDSLQEEPKKCMYSKDDYTDEDRKVLCDGCEEECKYSESDDFTKALAECIHQAQGSVFDPMVHAELWENELVKLAKSKEPVSEDLEDAAEDYCKSTLVGSHYIKKNAFKAGAKWQKTKDESITEDLGEYINELSKQFPEVSFAKLSRIAVRVAKWKTEHLWKHADGNDLPIIDREVIALLDNGKVVFAHRPSKGKYIGKNLTTGNIETFENKTYDEGGWNIPDVKYWLDVDLPKMED